MGIEKYNQSELEEVIDQLQTYQDTYEEVVDLIKQSLEELEDQSGVGIDKLVEEIEELEYKANDYLEDIEEIKDELIGYVKEMQSTGVHAVNEDQYIVVDDMRRFRLLMDQLYQESHSNQRIHIDKASTSYISPSVSKEEREELKDYILERNTMLEQMTIQVETGFVAMTELVEDSLEQINHLEEMEKVDNDYKMSQYDPFRRAVQITIQLEKRSIQFQIKHVHQALTVLGMIPEIGWLFDGLNAGLYLVQRDLKGASLSALSILPGAYASSKAKKVTKGIDGPKVSKTETLKDIKKFNSQGAKAFNVDEVQDVKGKLSKINQGLNKKEINIELDKIQKQADLMEVGVDITQDIGDDGELGVTTQIDSIDDIC